MTTENWDPGAGISNNSTKQTMTNENWAPMQAVEDAFSKVTTIDFLLEQLMEAADAQDSLAVVDISMALNAYLPVFTKHFDEKFKLAWNQTVGTPQALPDNLFE
jgi:hypothetical protein